MILLKRILNYTHPILKRLSSWYLSKEHTYSYDGIKVRIYPGVFHPGLFFSTKIFIEYLRKLNITDRRLLELGAGSGLLSIWCNKNGATVVASELNDIAIKGLIENKALNESDLEVVKSDLFEKIWPEDFDYIIINPPYYPKRVQSVEDMAWYCGEDFDYFRNLFDQIKGKISRTKVLMILSEDCNISTIEGIANKSGMIFLQVYTKRVLGEVNYIFEIRPN